MEIKMFCAEKFPENCYAAIFDDGIFLVDPGEFTLKLQGFVKENVDKIKYILLTHMHFDHILAAIDVKKVCPNAKIVIHTLDANGLSDSNLSLANPFGIEQEYIKADILCEDNDILTLGATEIKVIHTPGHTKGGVCFLVDNAIFSGDTVFENSIGRTDFPGGSIEQLSASLKRIKELNGEFIIYPGHGNNTTLDKERLFNPYMRNL